MDNPFFSGFLILLLLVAVTSIYLEWKRISQKNRWARLFSLALVFFSIYTLVSPFTLPFLKYRKNTTLDTLIILCPGFNDKAFNFTSHYKYITRDSTINTLFPQSVLVKNFTGIPILFPDVHTILIDGYGLPPEDLNELVNYSLEFNPPSQPFGIQTCHWTETLKPGEPLLVQGELNNPLGTKIKLLLYGQGKIQDSTIFNQKGTYSFQLNGKPLGQNKSVFYLDLIQNKDTLAIEPLPIQISSSRPIHIAILSSSPNFEARFLKTWLKNQKFLVWSRTLLTKNKESIYSVSDKEVSGPFSEKGIQDFDLVISDVNALKNLNRHDLSLLDKAIINNGLGLILEADSQEKTSLGFFSQFSLGLNPLDTGSYLTSLILPSGWKTQKLQVQSKSLVKKDEMQNLILDTQGEIKAGRMLYGRGKVVLTCIENTYSWALSGNNQDYSQLWSNLIQKAVKGSGNSPYYWVEPEIPRPGNEIHFHVLKDSIPGYQSKNLFSAFLQDSFLPFYWTGSFWANKPGWFEYPGNNPFHESVYVFKNTQWKSLDFQRNLEITKSAALNSTSKNLITTKKSFNELDFFSKLIFFLTLISALTYLWLEKKFWSD